MHFLARKWGISAGRWILVVCSILLWTSTGQAVSQSGACEDLAKSARTAAVQRDAGVSLRDSLEDIKDYGKPPPGASARVLVYAVQTQQRYAAATRRAYTMATLTPDEVYAVVERDCLKPRP
jgi:hypothetical protein